MPLAQALRQRLPLGQRQQHTEVRHRHVLGADLAGVGAGERRAEVHRQLVAEEVEIDPGGGAAALGAAEHVAVESAGAVEIVDMECKVEKAAHRWPAGGRDSWHGRG